MLIELNIIAVHRKNRIPIQLYLKIDDSHSWSCSTGFRQITNIGSNSVILYDMEMEIVMAKWPCRVTRWVICKTHMICNCETLGIDSLKLFTIKLIQSNCKSYAVPKLHHSTNIFFWYLNHMFSLHSVSFRSRAKTVTIPAHLLSVAQWETA